MIKKYSVLTLFIIDLLIIGSGIFFIFFSISNATYFKIINTAVHGAVFGVLVIFLGVRYFLSILKVRNTINKQQYKFSWKNFIKKV